MKMSKLNLFEYEQKQVNWKINKAVLYLQMYLLAALQHACHSILF